MGRAALTPRESKLITLLLHEQHEPLTNKHHGKYHWHEQLPRLQKTTYHQWQAAMIYVGEIDRVKHWHRNPMSKGL